MSSNQLYDPNLENSLLSTLLFNEDTDTIGIDQDIFFHSINKQIFTTILEFEQKKIPRNDVTIRDDLVSVKKVDAYIVEKALVEILTTNPHSSIEHLINRLSEYKKLRDIKSALLRIDSELRDGKSADEIEAALLSYGQKITSNARNELFSITPASAVEPKEAEFICKDWLPIPKKTVTIFSAGGGTGKTFITLQLAMRYLSENPLEKAFCWLSEDDIGIARERLNEITKSVYTKGVSTLDRLMLSADPTFSVMFEDKRSVIINPSFYKMKMKLKDIKFIVFDPLIAFYGLDENNNSHARQFMQAFTHWAAEEDKVIILIHHSTKNTTQSRGASAFVDAARAVYEIDKIKDSAGVEINQTRRIATLTKDNYRASKYLGGFKKEILVFPGDNSRKNVSVIEFLSNDEEYGIE